MVSEKSIKDESWDFINPNTLSYISTLLTHTPHENSSDFCLALDKVGLYFNLQNQAMYDGEDGTSQLQEFSVPSSEAVKGELAELGCGSSTAPQSTELFSRQSSLTEEWFGNVSNAHPNDISVDSSLEALFANTDWPDLGMPPAADAAVTDDCFADPSVYQAVNCQPADVVRNKETVASKSSPEFSTVCKTELQLVVPETVGECSLEKTGGKFYAFVWLIYSDGTIRRAISNITIQRPYHIVSLL